jgi:transposase
MKVITLAIDLAKDVFQLHGVDEYGKPLLRKQVRRGKLADTVYNIPPCHIVMESCSGSHYWARRFLAMGHLSVRLISPQHVKPYVKGNKNDRNDAVAIYEASRRSDMTFVPINSIEQQDLQMVHRIRSQLIKERTALINQIRGLLSEYGIVMKKNIATVRQQVPAILDDAQNELTALSREMIGEQYERLAGLDERIARYDQRILQAARQSPLCGKIEKIPGIGPITATAMIAAVGQAKEFKRGRHLAAWLGLVPKEESSGGKQLLLGISKRGDTYLRTLLIHGARSVVIRAEGKQDPLSQWINGIRKRKGLNVAAVALANKNARILWVLLSSDQEYRAMA